MLHSVRTGWFCVTVTSILYTFQQGESQALFAKADNILLHVHVKSWHERRPLLDVLEAEEADFEWPPQVGELLPARLLA